MSNIAERFLRTTEQEPPPPLAIDAPTAARMLNISLAHFYARLSAGQIPHGFYLGRRRLWSLEEFREWIYAGCPCADRWDAIKRNRLHGARSQMKRQVNHENL